MIYDYIILGGGLAGTILHDFLRKEATVLVIDSETGTYGSKVAAGIYNPVTGRRMVKSWMVDTLGPFARTYYGAKEEELDLKFIDTINIKRLFHNEQQRTEWLKKVDFYSIEGIVAGEIAPDPNDEKVSRDFGGVETTSSWRLNTKVFLEAMHKRMVESGDMVSDQVSYGDVQGREDGVQVGKYKGRQLIFCEGWRLAENPWFQHLPLVPNKGELLTIEALDLHEQDLLQKGMFVLPLGKNLYKVGATYKREQIDYQPTDVAKDWLLERLDRTIKVPYKVLKHEVGVRPTSMDRRPLIGRSAELKQFSVFNGFGSKGVSQMPWCAEQMKRHLIEGEALLPEIDIQRFLDRSSQ